MTSPSADLNAQLSQALAPGRVVAESLERGQGETPLTDELRVLSDPGASPPPGVILLGMTPQARGEGLAWLCGAPMHVLSVHLPAHAGLVEITVRDRGFSLETSDGRRQEFEDVGPFLEAIREEGLAGAGGEREMVEALRLRVPSEGDHRALRVLIPTSAASVLETPHLLSHLGRMGDVLVVAAEKTHAWTPPELALVERVRSVVEAGILFEVGSCQPDEESGTAGASQSDGAAGPPREFLRVGPTVDAARVLGRQRGAGDSVLLRRRVVRGGALANLVSERLDKEKRLLERRLADTQASLKEVDAPLRSDQPRASMEDLRLMIGDRLAKLSLGLGEANAVLSRATGPSLGMLDAALKNLDTDALMVEHRGSYSLVTLDPDTLARLKSIALLILKDGLRRDLVSLRDEVALMAREAGEKAAQVTRSPVVLSLPAPVEEDVWRAMERLCQPEVPYRGEVPREGWWKTLGRLRGAAMSVMMLGSLGVIVGSVFLGPAAGRLRVLLGPLVLLALVIGSVTIPLSKRREDAEKLERELAKVRDLVDQTLRRCIGEAQREKLTRFKAFLDEVRVVAARQLEEQFREFARRASKGADEARETLRAKMRRHESRMRELTALDQQMQRATMALRDLEVRTRGLVAAELRRVAEGERP